MAMSNGGLTMDTIVPAGFENMLKTPSKVVPDKVRQPIEWDSPFDPHLSKIFPSGFRSDAAPISSAFQGKPYKMEPEYDKVYPIVPGKRAASPNLPDQFVPFPSGIQRPTEYYGQPPDALPSVTDVKLHDTDRFLETLTTKKDPLLEFTAEGTPRRREYEYVKHEGDKIVHTSMYERATEEAQLISGKTDTMTAELRARRKLPFDEAVPDSLAHAKWEAAQKKIEEATRLGQLAEMKLQEAARKARESDEAKRLAEEALRRKQLAEQRAAELPRLTAERMDELRRELAHIRLVVVELEAEIEAIRRDLRLTQEVADQKQAIATTLLKDAQERRAQLANLEVQVTRIPEVRRETITAEERAKEAQEETLRVSQALKRKKEEAAEKARELAVAKAKVLKKSEELAAAIAEAEMADAKVKLAEEEAKAWYKTYQAKKDEAIEKAQEWSLLRKEAEALKLQERMMWQEVQTLGEANNGELLGRVGDKVTPPAIIMETDIIIAEVAPADGGPDIQPMARADAQQGV